MLNKEKIVKSAKSYIGCPFHHQGRIRDGLDCYGLIKLVADDNDFYFYDFTNYKTKPDPIKLLSTIRKACDEIEIDDAEVGDILVFWIKRGIPQHFGIISEKRNGTTKIIHSFANVKNGNRFGKVVEININEKWAKRIHSAFRYKVK